MNVNHAMESWVVEIWSLESAECIAAWDVTVPKVTLLFQQERF